MDIENIAVGYLKEYIGSSDFLKATINSDDKVPFNDGRIFIYKNENTYKKSDYYGGLDIQIKGKLMKNDKILDEIKYSVDANDLKAYYINGGCIYFVVYIDKEGNNKVGYYVILTPLMIKNLIETNKGKTNISVQLRRLPKNINTFYYIVNSGFADCKIQSSSTIKEINIMNVVEYQNKGFQLLSYTGPKENSFNDDFLFNYNHMLYLKKGEELLKINGENTIESLTTVLNNEVWIAGQNFYSNYKFTKYKEYEEVEIGKAIKIKYYNNENDTPKNIVNIKFNDETYNIDEYYIDLKFVSELYVHKKIDFHIKDEVIEFPLSFDNNDKQIDIDLINKKIEYLEDIVKSFKLLDLDTNEKLLVKGITEKDNYFLKLIIESVIYNKTIDFSELDVKTPFGFITINNLRLFCYIEKLNDGYKFFNLSNRKFDIFIKFDNDDKKHNITPYYFFRSEDYATTSNLNTEDVYAKLVSIGDVNDINDTVVKLIGAYDISKKNKLLELALKLLEWCKDKIQDEFLYHCVKLNILQIKFRKNIRFDYEEKEYINSLVYGSQIDDRLKIGAAILLCNKLKVDELMKKISNTDKDEFAKLPIYKLYNYCK